MGNLEFEMKISKETWINAYPETFEKIRKTRYVFPKILDEKWEIDFITDDKGTYAIIAECEMPADRENVNLIPTFVSEHLLKEIKHGNKNWNNRNLGNREVVEKMKEDLKNGE